MAVRDLPFWAMLFCLLTTEGATAQGMAHTMPAGPDPSQTAEPPAQRPWALTNHGAIRDAGGRLPSQATGPKRERVVRDICIGC
ncbi:hypothetical protein GPNCGGLF_LOCUS2108 [Methylorubrum aminovorans]